MSPSTRVRLLVAVVAVAAAGIAAGVALTSRGEEGPEAQSPPLELGVTLAATPQDRSLIEAERAYDQGDRELARERFEEVLATDPGSVEAQVGAAVAAWPAGTLQRLRAIADGHPTSGVARLHLGLVLFGDGDEAGARFEWREAEKRDPDSPSAVRAEDLLHPEMPPGRPFFVTSAAPAPGLAELEPQAQLDELRGRAEAGGVPDWLLYGSVLQRLGRTVSAREAFDRAVELDPGNLDAKTAAAVGRFNKDAPADAFSRLGPLATANPDAAVVRYHLGLMLLWLSQLDEANEQLEAARSADPDGVYGKEAGRLLDRLAEATGG